MRYRIRAATSADLTILVRHRRAMFEEMGEKNKAALARHDRDYRQWARTRLRRRELAGFIVETGGAPVASGCVWLQERQPRPGGDGRAVPYLLSMFTDTKHRGHGLATRIVKAAHAWCRKHGHGTISLHASKMGRNVYLKLGYKRTWEMRRRL
jgi:GNAT superfamily N-acetyltransferase